VQTVNFHLAFYFLNHFSNNFCSAGEEKEVKKKFCESEESKEKKILEEKIFVQKRKKEKKVEVKRKKKMKQIEAMCGLSAEKIHHGVISGKCISIV